MNTSQLPYLISIASTGSLSAAAQALGVTQPALSRYLAGLEHQTGMPLFRREKRRLVPTQAGILYLRSAREILSLEGATRRAIAALGVADTQELRVGVSPHTGSRILGEIFPPFHRAYPSVRITPSEGYAQTLLEQLRRGEITLAMTSGKAGNGLDMALLETEELGLAVPAFQAGVAPQSNTLDELPYTTLQEHRDSVFIMLKTGSTLAYLTQSLFEAAGFQPRVFFSTPNIVTQRQLISSGAGVGLLPLRPQRPDPNIVLYRLPHTSYFPFGVFFRTGYALTEPERYLCFLWLYYRMKTHAIICWNAFNRGLIKEYAPELAMQLPAEETQ